MPLHVRRLSSPVEPSAASSRAMTRRSAEGICRTISPVSGFTTVMIVRPEDLQRFAAELLPYLCSDALPAWQVQETCRRFDIDPDRPLMLLHSTAFPVERHASQTRR